MSISGGVSKFSERIPSSVEAAQIPHFTSELLSVGSLTVTVC